MDYINLAPQLGASSRLGFGCASIMGRVGREQSLRAIAAALDAGISHFDVARLYGYGEAEALLGEALRGKRDKVVIATKFGLVAPRAATALRGLKPLAQRIFASIPGSRQLFRALIGSTAQPANRFTAQAARESLETSLTALKTDYVDILFLHDCTPADLTDELVSHLDAQIAAGKIRSYGVASGTTTAANLAASPEAPPVILQFRNSICARGAEALPPRTHRYIAHSPFLGADRLQQLHRSQPSLFRLSTGRVLQPADIYPMMLSYALATPSVGVVLCSMLDEAHLRSNLASFDQPPFSNEEIHEFAAALTGRPECLLDRD